MLAGSAICTEQHWVCTNGNCSHTRIANTCHMGEAQAKLGECGERGGGGAGGEGVCWGGQTVRVRVGGGRGG